MRALYCVILGLMLYLWLAGCGEAGEGHHNVVTGEDGSLVGMMITPEPQTLGIAEDDEFLITWASDTTPPATFRVAVQTVDTSNTYDEVLTTIEKLDNASYRLSPAANFPAKTFLLLTVTGAGQTVRAVYLTSGTDSFLSDNATRKANRGAGQPEHVVVTR